MFHFLEISDYGVKLGLNSGRLVVQCPGKEPVCQSFDDLDAVILANPAVSITGAVLSEFGKRRIPLIACDKSYQPVSVMTPLAYAPAEHDAMLEAQISASLPFKKSLWQRLVREKIHGQAKILSMDGHESGLAGLAPKVRSGDPDNVEGRAAVLYWKTLNVFPRRDRLADDANQFFNYAYTLVFSAFSRHVSAASLHPHLGIHHHNQYNPFCLASDLMEPYRAFADMVVLKLLRSQCDPDLSKENRIFIIKRLYDMTVTMASQKTSLFNAVHETVVSFKRCLLQKDPRLLLLPVW